MCRATSQGRLGSRIYQIVSVLCILGLAGNSTPYSRGLAWVNGHREPETERARAKYATLYDTKGCVDVQDGVAPGRSQYIDFMCIDRAIFVLKDSLGHRVIIVRTFDVIPDFFSFFRTRTFNVKYYDTKKGFISFVSATDAWWNTTRNSNNSRTTPLIWIDAQGHTTIHHYNKHGNLAKVADLFGNTIVYSYDTIEENTETDYDGLSVFYTRIPIRFPEGGLENALDFLSTCLTIPSSFTSMSRKVLGGRRTYTHLPTDGTRCLCLSVSLLCESSRNQEYFV